ncbi:hypothetical protein AVEN_119976-1 [Araneus ventricosus]|uniref:Uncharacterized protein n=1 Tax=Araneus ventricosus TaxID=182803 RepID=A0A4Y2LHB0_ARAVE|nr:hypothetical protein AVEN_119976-1 [Araneus ventricosus]
MNNVLKCINCKDPHKATDFDCPKRKEEKDYLKFKCINHLSFIEARRMQNNSRDMSSYANIVKSANTDESSDKYVNKEDLTCILLRFMKETQNLILAALNEQKTFQSSLENAMQQFQSVFSRLTKETIDSRSGHKKPKLTVNKNKSLISSKNLLVGSPLVPSNDTKMLTDEIPPLPPKVFFFRTIVLSLSLGFFFFHVLKYLLFVNPMECWQY